MSQYSRKILFPTVLLEGVQLHESPRARRCCTLGFFFFFNGSAVVEFLQEAFYFITTFDILYSNSSEAEGLTKISSDWLKTLPCYCLSHCYFHCTALDGQTGNLKMKNHQIKQTPLTQKLFSRPTPRCATVRLINCESERD